MPFRFGAVELHETPLFQRSQQAVCGRGRKPGAHGEIAEAVTFVILGECLDDMERAIDGLHAAVPCLAIVLGGLAPDHRPLHCDLHPSTDKPLPLSAQTEVDSTFSVIAS